jgi:hypothetical protein
MIMIFLYVDICVCVLQVVGHEKDLREVIIKISNCLKKDYRFFVIDYNTCVAHALLLVYINDTEPLTEPTPNSRDPITLVLRSPPALFSVLT